MLRDCDRLGWHAQLRRGRHTISLLCPGSWRNRLMVRRPASDDADQKCGREWATVGNDDRIIGRLLTQPLLAIANDLL